MLNAYVFESLHQVREITRAWITEYNEERPHHSLGDLPFSDRRSKKLETLLPNWFIDGGAYGNTTFGSWSVDPLAYLLHDPRCEINILT